MCQIYILHFTSGCVLQKYDVTLHTQTDPIILQWSVSNYYIIVNEHSSSCFTSIHCMRDAVLAAIESCFFSCD